MAKHDAIIAETALRYLNLSRSSKRSKLRKISFRNLYLFIQLLKGFQLYPLKGWLPLQKCTTYSLESMIFQPCWSEYSTLQSSLEAFVRVDVSRRCRRCCPASSNRSSWLRGPCVVKRINALLGLLVRSLVRRRS